MIGKRVLGGFVKESKSKGAKTADTERTILDGISPRRYYSGGRDEADL